MELSCKQCGKRTSTMCARSDCWATAANLAMETARRSKEIALANKEPQRIALLQFPQNFDKVYNPAKLAFDRAPAVTFPKSCTVSTDTANVRSTPNGTIIKVLNRGASVQAVSAQGTWYNVKFRLGGKDWGTPAEPAMMHSSQVTCR